MQTSTKLAAHILAMADDAYLQGHPEWPELVTEAKDDTSQACIDAQAKQLNKLYTLNTALVEALELCRDRLHCARCGEVTCAECVEADRIAGQALTQAKGGA
jgi:hypothetical protein